jgi:hypothetical protein
MTQAEDLIDLIGSKVWQSTSQLGHLVGRYFWQLIHGQIQQSAYTRKAREVIQPDSRAMEEYAAGADMDLLEG